MHPMMETRVDLETMDNLCKLFDCRVEDLFEFIPDQKWLVSGTKRSSHKTMIAKMLLFSWAQGGRKMGTDWARKKFPNSLSST